MNDLSPYPQRHQRRTWYGLTGTVILESDFAHKAGFGRLVVFHPAAVNWLLRRGLPRAEAIALSLRHEFGHLQTLPLALVYAGTLVAVSADSGSWIRFPVILISSQAAWEMMAELYTRARGASYQATYLGVPRTPRILFWLMTGLMASLATFLSVIV